MKKFPLALTAVAILALAQPAFALTDLQRILDNAAPYDPTASGTDCSGGQIGIQVPSWGAQIFTQAAAKFNVSPNFLAAFYWSENGRSWRTPPEAGGPPWKISPAGAEGPFQFEPGTFASNAVAGYPNILGLTDASYAAAHVLASYGGTIGVQQGDLSNVTAVRPSMVLIAVMYDAGPNWEKNYKASDVTPTGPLHEAYQEAKNVLDAYGALTSNDITSACTLAPISGVSFATGAGGFSRYYKPQAPPPAFPWVPSGGFPQDPAHDYRSSYGQCTWWAAYNHHVHWGTDAWTWWGNSPQNMHENTPEPGDIVVYPRSASSPVGHVALVVAVSATTYTISESNFDDEADKSGNTIADIRQSVHHKGDTSEFIKPDPEALAWFASHGSNTSSGAGGLQ